mgnify:CR=1 FL=1|jgi:hypothetical protein
MRLGGDGADREDVGRGAMELGEEVDEWGLNVRGTTSEWTQARYRVRPGLK